MFYYLDGTVALIEPGLAVIDCGGVGFSCSTTTYTLASLKTGTRARLYTYCNIREDAFDIFGFSTKDERDCFTKLIAVSGVGPKAALAILSILSPDQFRLAVITQDEKSLTRAAGVGKKVAQRPEVINRQYPEYDHHCPSAGSVFTVRYAKNFVVENLQVEFEKADERGEIVEFDRVE